MVTHKNKLRTERSLTALIFVILISAFTGCGASESATTEQVDDVEQLDENRAQNINNADNSPPIAGNNGSTAGQIENGVFKISHEFPAEAKVDEDFSVTIIIEVKGQIQALSVRETLSGLKLVSQGDFIGIQQNTLRAFVISPTSGETVSFSYTASCTRPDVYSITGFAETKDVETVWETVDIYCTE
jgi:hypothetical protein